MGRLHVSNEQRSYELVEQYGSALNVLKSAVIVRPCTTVLDYDSPIKAIGVAVKLITLALMEQQEQIEELRKENDT